MVYQTLKKPKTLNGFFSSFEAYKGICYPGMEQLYYGRESPGPGAFMNQKVVLTSDKKDKDKFSIPKSDRGLIPSP
jgi:hypothetical protein